MDNPRYTIIETESGPFISESRVTVYDVMEDYDNGDGIYRISRTYNLSPLQVKTAIEYIERHRELLEAELADILVKKAERERYYRALEEKRKRERPPLPMTPRRQALYALIDKSYRELEEMANANHS